MQRKSLVVLMSLLVLAGCLSITCQAYGQGKIKSVTNMPAPVYVGQVSESELNRLVGCKYFREANCSNCGLTHYRSEVLKLVSMENFQELRSWFYDTMKHDVQGLEDHQIMRMFDAVLALSPWRELACGIAERDRKISPYIYAVIVFREYGQLVVYRMTAEGVFTKITKDRRVRLAVFP